MDVPAQGLQKDVAGEPPPTELPQALAMAQHVQHPLEALVHLDLNQLTDVLLHHETLP